MNIEQTTNSEYDRMSSERMSSSSSEITRHAFEMTTTSDLRTTDNGEYGRSGGAERTDLIDNSGDAGSNPDSVSNVVDNICRSNLVREDINRSDSLSPERMSNGDGNSSSLETEDSSGNKSSSLERMSTLSSSDNGPSLEPDNSRENNSSSLARMSSSGQNSLSLEQRDGLEAEDSGENDSFSSLERNSSSSENYSSSLEIMTSSSDNSSSLEWEDVSSSHETASNRSSLEEDEEEDGRGEVVRDDHQAEAADHVGVILVMTHDWLFSELREPNSVVLFRVMRISCQPPNQVSVQFCFGGNVRVTEVEACFVFLVAAVVVFLFIPLIMVLVNWIFREIARSSSWQHF